MKHLRYITALPAVVLLAACSFLDTGESTYYDKNETLYDPSRVTQLCTQVYSYLPDELSGISRTLQDAATDDAVSGYKTAHIQRFVDGSWSANDTVDNVLDKYYRAIHDANFYLENCIGLTFDDWKYSDGFQDMYNSYLNYQYEVRFLRAFYYFELVKRYGGVPLITKTLTKEQANTAEQASATDVLNFIVAECTDLVRHLPDKPTTLPGANANMQRIGKGPVLALKSRATLYAASPLFNPTGDAEKWKVAAAAADELIKQTAALGYAIDNDYNNLFGATNNQSPEIILCRPQGKTTRFEASNYPIGVSNGSGNTCPTENLVSAYEMNDGSKFNWDDPVAAADPYANRDPRLEMTIVCNGVKWPSTEPVETFIGGKNGQPLQNATPTGYYLRKYLNNKITFEAGKNTNSFDHNWVIFRYAEILLNYAEAAAQAYGPDIKPAGLSLTAREAVNLVRARQSVQMPAFPEGISTTDFLARLRNERRVELAFEGHRFWDLRRWRLMDEMKDIYQVRIEKKADGSFTYLKQKLISYTISNKLYFYPFANAELYKNKRLKQNPGW